MTPTNRLDYHYGNARNACFTHEEAEELARMACNAEYNPRHVPAVIIEPLEYHEWTDGFFCVWGQHSPIAIAWGYAP